MKKRLRSLDAMRGFAVLAMLPFHVLVFGGLMIGLFGGGGDGGGSNLELFVVDWDPPLCTGLLIFFFVTGVSLAVSLARRRETHSTSAIARHVVLRYGGYFLLGVVTELLFVRYLLFEQTNVLEAISETLFSVAAMSSPIIGLALGAIIAFPLILTLSWKRLGMLALVVAVAVGIVLYSVVLPQAASLALDEPSWLNLVLTGWFGILKGLPVILYGAAVGKLVVAGRDLKKVFLLIGGGISLAYILIPTLLGTGMVHIVLAIWAFPHAILFIAGLSVAMFAVFQFIEGRRLLSSLSVLGRLSIFTYYGHFIIDVALWMLIGTANLTLGLLFGMMVGVTAVLWVVFYFFSRWRWGPPSTW